MIHGDLNNSIWSLKYRPNTVSETILPEATKKMIQEVIASKNIPCFLFDGTGGIGKTSLARAIANEMGSDLLFINASLEGNIDTLRITIAQFVSTVSFSENKKIVLLDEADFLNSQSTQPALRAFIDEFSSNATFILTCNNKHRIIAPLISRLTVVDFKFTKEEKQSAAMSMHKRCCQILDQELIKYEKKTVAALVLKNFPDFRKTLNQLQRYSTSGEIDSGILVITDDSAITDLVQNIKDKDFNKCRQWVANNQLDSATFYRSLYDKMLPLLVPAMVPQIILTIANSQYQSAQSVDQEINQIAAIIQIMQGAVFK